MCMCVCMGWFRIEGPGRLDRMRVLKAFEFCLFQGKKRKLDSSIVVLVRA